MSLTLPRPVCAKRSTGTNARHLSPSKAVGRRQWLSGSQSRHRFGIAAVTAFVLAVSIALPVSTQAATDNASQAEGVMLNVISLASARLATAQPIAQWKWENKQPLQDSKQDQVDSTLIGSLIKEAPHFGLEPAYATSFLNDQAAANQQLQSALFDQWHHGNAPGAPDEAALQNARGSLYQISEAMMAALIQAQPLQQEQDCPIWLSHAKTRWETQMTTLTSDEKAALTTALRHVCTGGIGGTA